VNTLAEVLARTRWPYRVFGGLFAVFAAIALVLSAVGIFAVTAYSVAQRSQEIGVRMALGAGGSRLTWLVLRRAAVQLLIGLVIGLAGAVGLGQVLRSVLMGGTANDPLTYAAVVVVFVLVTVVASVLPARRAAKLDPLFVLRGE
jgi:ABC-type antimicrobial peptide transport system permease subunit